MHNNLIYLYIRHNNSNVIQKNTDRSDSLFIDKYDKGNNIFISFTKTKVIDKKVRLTINCSPGVGSYLCVVLPDYINHYGVVNINEFLLPVTWELFINGKNILHIRKCSIFNILKARNRFCQHMFNITEQSKHATRNPNTLKSQKCHFFQSLKVKKEQKCNF